MSRCKLLSFHKSSSYPTQNVLSSDRIFVTRVFAFLLFFQDVDVPAETEISFAAAVAFGTFLFCMTMSCLGLCIKCLMWVFGHRGVRRLSRVTARSRIGTGSEVMECSLNGPIGSDSVGNSGLCEETQVGDVEMLVASNN